MDFKSGSFTIYCGSHHRVVGGEIKNLRAVTPPSRESATGGRDLPLPTRPWKGGHINFVSARLIRAVRDPPAVWRKLAKVFFKFRVKKSNRLVISGKRQEK